MTENEIMELLEGISSDDLKKHIKKLNDIGIITDTPNPEFLDDHDFPHMVIKNWKKSHEEYLRVNGYKGDRLIAISENVSENSPIYILYDSEEYNMQSACKYAVNEYA